MQRPSSNDSLRQQHSPGAVPLAYRLPTPPPVFVGRERERRFLREVLERGSLAVVRGLPCVGKSALVREVLHRSFADRLDRAIAVDLRGASRDTGALLRILEGLREVGPSAVETTDAGDSPDADVRAALDRADASGATVVLEGVDAAPRPVIERLLAAVARYATESLWVATSRRELSVQPAGQDLECPPMPEDDLRRLGAELSPDPDAEGIERALAESGGLPGLFVEMVTGSTTAVDARRRLLEDLDEGELRLVEHLALVESAVAAEVLAGSEIWPGEAAVGRLAERQSVDWSRAGLRLVDAVRAPLLAELSDERQREHRRRLASLLVDADRPDSLWRALTLLRENGDFDAVAEVLEDRGDLLVSEGRAAKLWSVVREAPERLRRWKLAAAAEVGASEVLEECDLGQLDDGESYHAARLELMRGNPGEALRRARSIDAPVWSGESGEERECRVAVLAADAALQFPDASETADLLEEFAAGGTTDSSLLARVALARAKRGDVEEAVELVESLRDRGAHRDPDGGAELGARMCRTLHICSRLRGAREILDELDGRGAVDEFEVFRTRRLMMVRADVRLDTGDFARARRLLERLDERDGPVARTELSVRLSRAKMRLARGDLEGLDDHLADGIRRARRDGFLLYVLAFGVYRIQLALLRGEKPPKWPLEGDDPAARFREIAEIYRAEAQLRHGATPPRDFDADEYPNSDIARRANVARYRAAEAILAGGADERLEGGEQLLHALDDAGYVVGTGRQLEVLCDLAAVAGSDGRLEKYAARLVELGKELNSGRFELLGRLHRLVGGRAPPAPMELETVAKCADTSPVAARRARRLLGAEPALDAVDRVWVERVTSRGCWELSTVASVEETTAWSPGWGLDRPSRAVWLPEGDRVDLDSCPTRWDLLTCLADHGGRADKETLVREVWDEEKYHPMRHDNRLRLCVRKVREMIEKDPSEPTRLRTADRGYELSGAVRELRHD